MKWKQLTEDQSKMLMTLLMADKDMPDDMIAEDFLCNVVKKRIEACKLPIEYDNIGLAYLSILCEGNPGRAVISLIDLLNKEVPKITVQSMVDVYPDGHYSNEALEERIDTLKEKKDGKWDYLY